MADIAGGDESAFRALYDAYKDKVYNTALYQLQSVEDAEEVTQDVFVEIYRSVASFKGEAQVSTWIYRIAVNKCLDKLRQRQRKKRSVIARFFGELNEAQEPADFHHPGIAAEQRETYGGLFRAIHQLPENQKTAFILTYIEDLPQKETAAIMNLNIKALESLLSRAKAGLRKSLGGSATAPRRIAGMMSSKTILL